MKLLTQNIMDRNRRVRGTLGVVAGKPSTYFQDNFRAIPNTLKFVIADVTYLEFDNLIVLGAGCSVKFLIKFTTLTINANLCHGTGDSSIIAGPTLLQLKRTDNTNVTWNAGSGVSFSTGIYYTIEIVATNYYTYTLYVDGVSKGVKTVTNNGNYFDLKYISRPAVIGANNLAAEVDTFQIQELSTSRTHTYNFSEKNNTNRVRSESF